MRARHVWLAVVVACAGLSMGVAHAQLVGVTFEQSNLQLDTFTLNNSDWGSAEVEFIGSASTMYFNAEVDGVWRVQDMPVVSVLGPGMQQKMTFNFSLGSVGPHPNAFTRYSLTPAPLGAAPTANPGVVNLQPRQVTMSGGEGGFSLPYASAAGALIGGLVPFLPIPNGKYATYPNQECGVDECVPAAVSNSVMWLNTTFNMNIPAGNMSIAAMKTATGWVAPQNTPPPVVSPIPGTGGAPLGWWNLKQAYFNNLNIPIMTMVSTNINDAITALSQCKDIEIGGGGHRASVVGITPLANMRYAIVIAHDTMQGVAGGTRYETVIYDQATGRLSGATFFNDAAFRNFVIEMPPPSSLAVLALAGLASARRRRS